MVKVPTMKLFHTILVTTKFLAPDITYWEPTSLPACLSPASHHMAGAVLYISVMWVPYLPHTPKLYLPRSILLVLWFHICRFNNLGSCLMYVQENSQNLRVEWKTFLKTPAGSVNPNEPLDH